MTSIVAAAEVVVQFCAEHGWDCGIFVEDTVSTGGIILGERLWSEVFCHPVRVSSQAVVGGEVGRSDVYVRDGRCEAILEHSGRIHRC